MTQEIWNRPKVGVFGSGVTDDEKARGKAGKFGKDTKADIIEDSDPEKLVKKVVREIKRK